MIRASKRAGVLAASLSAAVLAASLVSPAAQAGTLDFDSLNHFDPIPNGYGGLNWDNFYTLNGSNSGIGNNGYKNGLVSPDMVAFNWNANPASISGSNFTLSSGYFTAAWNDGLTVDVQGYVSGVLTFDKSFVIDTSGPMLETFNWAHLSSVTFTSSGGFGTGYYGYGTHFALDNLTVHAAAVPESASWLMMVGGLGLAGGAMRARRKSAVSFS